MLQHVLVFPQLLSVLFHIDDVTANLLNYIYWTKNYSFISDGSLATMELVVNSTETIVTGLTPGVLYTFSVSAENDVSSQDNNINARSLSTTATTLYRGLYLSYL